MTRTAFTFEEGTRRRQEADRWNGAKWESNGDHYSPNEGLLDQQVIVRWGDYPGSLAKEQIGTLKMIRAATRGNFTLAVVWRVVRESDGRSVKRNLPIWTLRKHPFTIEAAPLSHGSETA